MNRRPPSVNVPEMPALVQNICRRPFLFPVCCRKTHFGSWKADFRLGQRTSEHVVGKYYSFISCRSAGIFAHGTPDRCFLGSARWDFLSRYNETWKVGSFPRLTNSICRQFFRFSSSCANAREMVARCKPFNSRCLQHPCLHLPSAA